MDPEWRAGLMSTEQPESRLSRLATLWTVVGQANQGEGTEQDSAQRRMLDYYGNAIRRYLRGALRDEDAADEVFQEFAYRFLHGDLKGADQARGRFRDYVKSVLFHLIADHCRKKKRLPVSMPEGARNRSRKRSCGTRNASSWKAGATSCSPGTRSALEDHEKQTGQPYYSVLRFRADHADLSSTELAEQLSSRLGRPLTSAGIRQTLHRGRDKFADLLLDLVEQSLRFVGLDEVERELADLGLLEYCRPALERRQKVSS